MSTIWFIIGLLSGAAGGIFLGRFIARRVKL